MKKRLFSLMLVLAMALVMLPTTALAADESVKVGGVEMYSADSTTTYYKNGDTTESGLTGTKDDWNAKLERNGGVYPHYPQSLCGCGYRY